MSVSQLTDVGVAFGRSVKLGNVGNVEAFDKLLPNLRPQTVAVHHADLVAALFGSRRCSQQVAARFSDVLCHLYQRVAYRPTSVNEAQK